MKDRPEVIPLLHSLRRATFFTHDLGFFDPSLRHNSYALICLDVSADAAATYIRRFLRHPAFRAQGQRLGRVILLQAGGLRYWQIHGRKEQVVSWPKG